MVWTLVVTGLALLLRAAFESEGVNAGFLLFEVAMLATMAMGALVMPALTATSVNGDRLDGTLASIQLTLLTPAEIVIGKILAAAVAGLAVTAGTLPAVAVAVTANGVRPLDVAIAIAIVTATHLTVVALGLAMSTLLPRPVASTAITYLLVVTLGLGGPVLYALTSTFVRSPVQVTVLEPEFDEETGSATGCSERLETRLAFRSDLTWWLLATSPFVVLGDAVMAVSPSGGRADFSEDIPDDEVSFFFALMSVGTRDAMAGPQSVQDWCQDQESVPRFLRTPADATTDQLPSSLTWQTGTGVLAGIFVMSLVVAVRRMRVPLGRLPRGLRIG